MQSERKRRKRSRFASRLYAAVLLILTVVNICMSLLLLTHVQSIQVVGNEESRAEDIVSWIREDPLTVNSVYTYCKFKGGFYTLPVLLEDIKLTFRAPWALRAEVKEKQVIGCLRNGGEYVCFDADGLVLKKTKLRDEKIPEIEGISAKSAGLYEKIKTDDEKVFSYVVKITDETLKRNLNPTRIVYEGGGMDLYFDSVCVRLGKSGFDEKIGELAYILPNLEGKSGCLSMEHYSAGGTVSFKEQTAE